MALIKLNNNSISAVTALPSGVPTGTNVQAFYTDTQYATSSSGITLISGNMTLTKDNPTLYIFGTFCVTYGNNSNNDVYNPYYRFEYSLDNSSFTATNLDMNGAGGTGFYSTDVPTQMQCMTYKGEYDNTPRSFVQKFTITASSGDTLYTKLNYFHNQSTSSTVWFNRVSASASHGQKGTGYTIIEL